MTLESISFGGVTLRSLLSTDPRLVERAFIYADAAHRCVGQVRKYTGEPYILHPLAVATLVSSVRHTGVMLAAALLHDVVEDTPRTLEDIGREFGDEVQELVFWLTDVSCPSDGNRAARKALDRARIARAPEAAKTIKLADLIDNSRSILAHDRHFARVYLPEKAALLEVLTQGDAALLAQARALVEEALRTLNMAH